MSTMDHLACISPSGAKLTRFKEAPRYAEGLYDLNNGLYAWMVPNGSWGESNAGLIVGDGESLLVDTLWDLKYTRAMLEAMRSLTDAAPIRSLINTHADGDHFWGNELVTGAEIITSKASYEELLTVKPQSMIMLRKVGKLCSALRLFNADKVGHWFQGMVAPYDFAEVHHTPATRTFSDRLTLQAGGREVQLIEAGPAHTQGDLMVYVPDARTLFSGDLVFAGSTPITWTGHVDDWLGKLDDILAMDVDIIVPGHGPVTDKDGVRQVKAYWEYVNAQARTRYDAGMSARDAAYDIVLDADFATQPFSGWNSPERMMTNVHMLFRYWRGRTDHARVPELMNLMRKQALLAYKLPDAQPAIMRKQ